MAAVIAILAIGVSAYIGLKVTTEHYLRISERALNQNLTMTSLALQSEIGRFHTLPAVLKRDPRVLASVSYPLGTDFAALNAYLAQVSAETGAGEIIVFDRSGTVIASSDWKTGSSQIGKNFSFRPYFRDAMATGEGRFYAIGVNTGTPGYFLAERLGPGPNANGVVAVKVDLSVFESTWRDEGLQFALIDSAGVVFLSSEEDWKYRAIRPLAPEALAEIERNRQYDGIDLTTRVLTADFSWNHEGKGPYLNADRILSKTALVGDEGWRLVVARPFTGQVAVAALVVLSIALIGLVIAGGIYLIYQRGQLVRIKSQQSAILERRVEERTHELAAEIDVRRKAEESLRAAQNDLVQATKLAALGQMSAALVHEVSQPITALAATLTAAERRLASREALSARKLVERAQSLTIRLQHIVRHLRSFAKKDQGEATRMNITASIAAALELTQTRANEIGVAIAQRGLDRPVEVMGSPVRIEQVLVNILLNALDAVAGRAPSEVGIDLDVDGIYAVILVWDTGPGIPADVGDRLSEPFFTTKTGEGGLGLGLSISQSILADFDASMLFRAREGGGTVCEVRLPLAQNAEQTEAAQ